jgi:hypothetical protein
MDTKEDEEDRKDCKILSIQILNNIGLAQIQANLFKDAIETLNAVDKFYESNSKTL